MTGLYILIFLSIIRLIWHWYSIRKQHREMMSPKRVEKDHTSNVFIQSAKFLLSENIAKNGHWVWNSEEFEDVGGHLADEKESLTEDEEEQEDLPIAHRNIELQKLEAVLLKYSLKNVSDTLEDDHRRRLIYEHGTIQLTIDCEQDIIYNLHLSFLKREAGPWLVDLLHEIGQTWNLIVLLWDELTFLVDLRNREQIERYFSQQPPD